MGVRVRVEIEYRGRKVSAIGLLNTGYESDVPEIIVPVAIAEQLGIWPKLPEGTVIESYRTASGIMTVYRVSNATIRLITDEGFGDPIPSYIVISEQVDEILISDQLISSMGIVIEDPAKGLWRLRWESKIRRSIER